MRALFFCLYLCCRAASCDVLLSDVTVIDVKRGSRIPNQSIVIRGERIAAVRAYGRAAAKQKFVIPGLWDMHVHLRDGGDARAFLEWGVTGVRDMGSDFEAVKRWRREIETGQRPGPHIETCGAAVDGWPADDARIPVVVARSANDARTVFDRLDAQRVDFIGILDRLPRDAYFALLERSRKWFSTVSGPLPAEVSANEAVDARQKSLDNMDGLLLACSSAESRLRPKYVAAVERRDWAAASEFEAQAAGAFDAAKAAALFRRMALFDTRAVPMLAGLSGPRQIRLADLVRRMSTAGVKILAGSDAGLPGRAPGAPLHDELQALVDARLSPLEALRAATAEPAAFLDADESLGSVEAGKLADLVVLDADPLSDIRNTRKISAVIVRGKYMVRK